MYERMRRGKKKKKKEGGKNCRENRDHHGVSMFEFLSLFVFARILTLTILDEIYGMIKRMIKKKKNRIQIIEDINVYAMFDKWKIGNIDFIRGFKVFEWKINPFDRELVIVSARDVFH